MASRPVAKEYKVILSDTPSSKLVNIMRFKHPHKCDLEKLTDPLLYRQEQPEKVETEEEAKRREEWRKKKKFKARKQNADDRPWVLKEKKKDGVTFYGRKEGGINTSASYYILRLAPSGDFEAAPVNNWYDFVPPVKYNYLNDEEAEERFEKRNKTLNYFSIMVSKRIKENDGTAEEEDRKGAVGTSKGLIRSDDSDDDDGFTSPDSDTEVKKRSSTSVSTKGQKKKKREKLVSIDDEAEEESDEGDFESKEVDYSSSSSNNDDDERIKAVREEPRDDAEVERKEEKGIDKVFDDSSTDEEEDELTESGKALKALINKHQGNEDEDEAPDNEDNDSKMETEASEDPKTVNVKQEDDDSSVSAPVSSSPPAKKPKLESPGQISPDEVMKYLKRKPLTSKALVKKFVKLKTELDKGQIVNMLGEVLKSMPQIEKQKIKGKMYLSINTDNNVT